MVDIRSLAKNDLNLLVTLHVLLEEKSVSRAAERLFLSQPAVSKSLSRLREMISDPLFTRSSHGLVPTPTANALAQPLAEWLAGASVMLQHDDFDPSTYRGEIRMGVAESLDMVFIPQLVKRLSQAAPGISIVTTSHSEQQLRGLEKGDLDFLLGIELDLPSDNFQSVRLHTDTGRVLARDGHPLRGKPIEPEEMLVYPRIGIHLPDGNQLMVLRESHSLANLLAGWPAVFETDNIITALAVLSSTDYLLPSPMVLKAFAGNYFHFDALDVNETHIEEIRYCLTYHDRVAQSPVHKWLLDTMLSMFAGSGFDANLLKLHSIWESA